MGIFKEIIAGARGKEKEAPPPLDTVKKSIYHFSHTRKQWIREKLIEHEVEGDISVIISKHDPRFFKWSIHFNNIECRKKTNFIPEHYILWDYVQRADFFMNKNGEILVHEFESFGQDEIYKEKIKKVSQYIEDKTRKKAVLSILKKINKSTEALIGLLEINPVIQVLYKELDFHTKNREEKLSPVTTYYTKENLKNHFGKDIHLPIKKFSVIDQRKEEEVTGSCVGGAAKEEMDKKEFYRYMKKLAGKMQIGRELLLDYSEYYYYSKKEFADTLTFTTAENYIQTAVAEAWYLEEHTILNKI